MRELTKSLLHCSWALSLFGAHQLRNAAVQRSALQLQEFAEALDNIAEAACRDLSPWELTAYRVGTTIQDSVLDVVFRGIGSAVRAAPAALPRAVANTSANRTPAARRSEMPSVPAYVLNPAPAGDKQLYVMAGA